MPPAIACVTGFGASGIEVPDLKTLVLRSDALQTKVFAETCQKPLSLQMLHLHCCQDPKNIDVEDETIRSLLHDGIQDLGLHFVGSACRATAFTNFTGPQLRRLHVDLVSLSSAVVDEWPVWGAIRDLSLHAREFEECDELVSKILSKCKGIEKFQLRGAVTSWEKVASMFANVSVSTKLISCDLSSVRVPPGVRIPVGIDRMIQDFLQSAPALEQLSLGPCIGSGFSMKRGLHSLYLCSKYLLKY